MEPNQKETSSQDNAPINPYAAAGSPGSIEAAEIDAIDANNNPSNELSSANASTTTDSLPDTKDATNQPKDISPNNLAQHKQPTRRRPTHSSSEPNTALFIAGALVIATIVILVSYGLKNYFHSSPYGPEIKIDNFDQYFKGVPQDNKDAVFSALYNRVETNIAEGQEIPEKGAVIIRDFPIANEYNAETNIHYGRFFVNLPTIEQSYQIQFEWSTDAENTYLSGYGVLVTCPDSEHKIYDNFACHDAFTAEQEEIAADQSDFPIMKHLPIHIAYATPALGYVEYKISGMIKESSGKKEYVITILDLTGGNFERALDRIRKLDCNGKACNPNDYKIEYLNRSSSASNADIE